MDLSKIAQMPDAQLKTYIISMKDNMTAPYQCIWNKDAHKSSSHNKAFNYIRHVIGCKHRQDHIHHTVSNDSAMKFPVYEEDMENYRGCLNQMNGCYEFMFERLGDPGWGTYNNKINNLMVRFFTKYCNMGLPGHQQSVLYNGSKWKIKKNKDTPYVMLDQKKMFEFFIAEFRPLLEEAMLNYVSDSSSFEFWYFVLNGERTAGQLRRMEEQDKINYSNIKTKICKEHYIEKPSGKVVFTKGGKPIYGVNDPNKCNQK